MTAVKNVSIASAQRFAVTVKGLLPLTEFVLFFNSKRVEPGGFFGSIVVRLFVDDITYYPGQYDPSIAGPPASTKLVTDINGRLDFYYYYQDDLVQTNYTTEEEYFSFSGANSGAKSLMVVDKVSADQLSGLLVNTFDSTARTDTLKKSRSYAETLINISYDISFVKPVSKAISSVGSGDYGGYNSPTSTPGGSVTDFGIVSDPTFGDLGQTSPIGGYDFGLGYGFDNPGGSGDGGGDAPSNSSSAGEAE